MKPAISHSPHSSRRVVTMRSLGLVALAAVTLTGCAVGETPAKDGAQGDAATNSAVTLVVHSSFPNDEFAAAATAATGYEVEVISAGDGGELTNKLVLTKGAPIADAFFGVDTIFASRLVSSGAIDAYTPADLPAGAEPFTIAGSGLTPVDFGATCVNIDPAWFADHDLAEPATFEDLVRPEYRDQTVLLDPTASSTGASFLVGTVAAFGEDGYVDYWQQLVDNGARIEQSWSDAYYGQFTQGGEGGQKPIVVSYASSPAFTVNEAGDATTTKALMNTCTRQAEYAGVLAGAANPEGARAVVDYLVSHEFQSTVAEAMYMNPVDETVDLPAAWAMFAPEPSATDAHDLNADEIERGRETWLRTLGDEIGL